MSSRRSGVSTERIAAFGLVIVSLFMTAGGFTARHLIAIGVPRTLAAGAVPWAVTAVAGANEPDSDTEEIHTADEVEFHVDPISTGLTGIPSLPSGEGPFPGSRTSGTCFSRGL